MKRDFKFWCFIHDVFNQKLELNHYFLPVHTIFSRKDNFKIVFVGEYKFLVHSVIVLLSNVRPVLTIDLDMLCERQLLREGRDGTGVVAG